MIKDILIYDIECATNGHSVSDINFHVLKYFGAYSYKNNEFYFLKNKDDIQNIINSHKIMIGFNNKSYDNIILFKSGINLDYKIVIDLLHIIRTRAGLIQFKDTFLSYHLKNYSLDTITKTIGLVDEGAKKEIDYKLFDIENPNREQYNEIKDYTIRDIEITKKLFDWINKIFDGWKHHLSKKDVRQLKHISTAPSVYTYKVLANKCGFKEEYIDIDERIYQGIGGYVAYPAAEKVEGDIYCLDFSSLYPHIMIQCNLYGRNKITNDGWNGNNKFKVKGYYNTKEMHIVSKVLMDIYNERKELKEKKDIREYGLKIVLNTCYGILRNPKFKNVYDNVAGEDCCLIGQQWIMLARKIFKDAGYFIIYTDTDSIYIQDVFKDKNKILETKNQVINEIKLNVPFPVDTFDMGIDYEIDMIHFFRGGNTKDESSLNQDDIENQKLGLMKKNYLFIYKKDGQRKVFIKNLGIIKRTCSEISKIIFWQKLVPKILETNNCKFYNNELQDMINELLQTNINLITKRFTIQNKNSYTSKTCIQMQAYNYIPTGLNEPLGSGIHYLIPNKRFGFGKDNVKYCTVDEFTKYLTINDLYLHGIMRELKYFNVNYVDVSCKEKTLDEALKQLELW